MPNPHTSATTKIQRCLRPQAMNCPYPRENRTTSLRRRTDAPVMLRPSGNLSSNDGMNSSATSRDTTRLTTITSEKSVRLACCSSATADDSQRTDRRQQRPEDGNEYPPVAVVAVMIDHDDRRVDDDPQRDRDPGERINMDIQPEQVVKDHGDQDIDHERRHDDQQIAEIPADQIDEQQQDGDARASART